MKKLFTLLVIFYFSSMLLSAKENIIIEYFSAEQQELELKQIATIEFTEEYIYFLDRSGDEIASKKIENVRKISFVDGETAVENIADITMIVYPNPTMDALFVQGVQKGDVVRIYTLDGTLLKTQTVEDELLQINVEDIATGSYLLQSNTNVVKFIKK
ncbi:MAG: T9SS type A sorting domain-containing protein [Paludibacteraceae bacterium]|nr:T9SS type A sorting domain-containing protein [Paludibacteraceae bacterium]